MISSFSRDSEQCRKCNYYKNCDEKRMALCGYIIPDEAVAETTNEILTQCVMPNGLFMCDISENMDLQAVRTKISQEWSDQVYWAIRGAYDGKSKV